MSATVKPKTFGSLPFRSASLEAPAVNGGPFNCAPSMLVVVAADESAEHHLRCDERAGRYRVGTSVNFDSDGGRFFLVYSEDCYFPPLFVVRADSEEEAIDLLLENHPKQFEMSREDVDGRDADGMPETVGYTGSGVPYDNEILNVRELILRTVHFA